jgi:hypothetical protein
MSREILTLEQVKAAIRRRIAASHAAECRRCRAPGIYILWQSDENGCNWAPQELRCAHSCAGVMERVVQDVQRLYNVRPLDVRSETAQNKGRGGENNLF